MCIKLFEGLNEIKIEIEGRLHWINLYDDDCIYWHVPFSYRVSLIRQLFYVEDSEKNYQNIILFLEFPRRALLLYDRRRMSCNLEKKITDDVVCYISNFWTRRIVFKKKGRTYQGFRFFAILYSTSLKP